MASMCKKLALMFLAMSMMIAAVQGSAPHYPNPSPPSPLTCPINPLKLGVCGNVLNLLKLHLGVPANEQCCPLLAGLVDLDAAMCLCMAIRANILGIINLNVPVDLVLLLNQCGKTSPPGFTCPPESIH